MSRVVIYPYRMYSQSSRDLARELGAIRVYPDRRYRPRHDDLIINWGNSVIPDWLGATDRGFDSPHILNSPARVANASNKLYTFRMLQDAGIPTVRWTTNRDEASRRFDRVAVRHKLTGHSGEGMEVCDSDELLPDAPLYTEMVDNQGEYRIHVFNGSILDYTKKRRRLEDDPTDEESDLRNLDSGWIYVRGNLRRLERIEELAINAVHALGLDFGAVDIIKDENGDVKILEVNTAVGLAPTTLSNYVEVINNMIEENATSTA